jgi:hypothetical protein
MIDCARFTFSPHLKRDDFSSNRLYPKTGVRFSGQALTTPSCFCCTLTC